MGGRRRDRRCRRIIILTILERIFDVRSQGKAGKEDEDGESAQVEHAERRGKSERSV